MFQKLEEPLRAHSVTTVEYAGWTKLQRFRCASLVDGCCETKVIPNSVLRCSMNFPELPWLLGSLGTAYVLSWRAHCMQPLA
jgi:hypothetical protein